MSKQRDSPYSAQREKRKGNNGVKGSKEERKSSPFLRQGHDNLQMYLCLVYFTHYTLDSVLDSHNTS